MDIHETAKEYLQVFKHHRDWIDLMGFTVLAIFILYLIII